MVTILRNLLSGGGQGGASSALASGSRQVRQLPHDQAGLLGKGLAAYGQQTQNQQNPQLPTSQAVRDMSQGQQNDQADQLGAAANINKPVLQADMRLNTVIIRDVPENMPYYKRVIAELDRPVGLIEIKAAIVDVDYQYVNELGVNWNLQTGTLLNGGIAAVGGVNATSGLTPTATDLAVGEGLNFTTILSPSNVKWLMNQVHALEQKSKARVLSQPSVLTLNNVEALMEKTNTFYVKVPGAYQVDLYNVTAGMTLKVVPHIIDNAGKKTIKLMVNIQNGAISSSTVDSLPVVENSTLNTQAEINENESLLLGGYCYESEVTESKGVPLISSIPVLGRLFSTKTKNKQRMERLIIVSPRILTPDPVAAMANAGPARVAPVPASTPAASGTDPRNRAVAMTPSRSPAPRQSGQPAAARHSVAQEVW